MRKRNKGRIFVKCSECFWHRHDRCYNGRTTAAEHRGGGNRACFRITPYEPVLRKIRKKMTKEPDFFEKLLK